MKIGTEMENSRWKDEVGWHGSKRGGMVSFNENIKPKPPLPLLALVKKLMKQPNRWR